MKACVFFMIMICSVGAAMAHGVADKNQGFLASVSGIHIIPYMYLGAKHMLTGYDHLLYLAGVIFYLTKLRDIASYVSLFALGHSLTLLFGVLSGTMVNPFLVDAVVGLSVSYKALENLKVINLFNPKAAVFAFGLVHGFGLSTKLQDFSLSSDGLLMNMISFNLGVEIGQVIGLFLLFGALSWLKLRPSYDKISENVNVLLFAAGVMLFGLHAVGFITT